MLILQSSFDSMDAPQGNEVDERVDGESLFLPMCAMCDSRVAPFHLFSNCMFIHSALINVPQVMQCMWRGDGV
ncbi:MAG: hypothetical protein CMH81_07400 [Nitrospiraceae bacterium]|jgi:hypothetical protein|nr:hypothetical protein [Nitrospiraceae bacterium]